MFRFFLSLSLFLICIPHSFAGNGVDSVSYEQELPSFHCLGFRLLVKGDDNLNAVASVEFKKTGEDIWRKALPLRRVELAAMEEYKPKSGEKVFAGSLLFLKPDTKYDVKISLNDPDGGSKEKTFNCRTWKEPAYSTTLTKVYVAPGSGDGDGTEGSPIKGLANALKIAKPSTHFVLLPGSYKGGSKLSVNGTSEKPIVFSAKERNKAIIKGPANGCALNVSSRKYVFIEDLVLRDARWAIRAIGAQHITIRRCHLKGVGAGVFTDGKNQKRIVVMDNIIEGVLPFPFKKGQKTTYSGELRGAELSGIGNIIAYNRISGFRDGADVRPPGPIRGTDLHNNDIFNCYDDGIELDGTDHNVRAYYNRITNTGIGMSFQPIRGGPAYMVRNTLINIGHETFKLHLTPTNKKFPDWKNGPHRTSGGLIYHNTVIKPGPAFRVWSDEGPAHYYEFKNNILMSIGNGSAIDVSIPLRHTVLDGNGYINEGKGGLFAFIEGKKYYQFRDFQKKGNQEKNGIFSSDSKTVFNKSIPVLKKGTVAKPSFYELREDSVFKDKAQVLPGINDQNADELPDIGAIEQGQPVYHVGPRN